MPVCSTSAERPSGVAPFSSSASIDETSAARSFSANAGPMPSISSMSPLRSGAAGASAGGLLGDGLGCGCCLGRSCGGCLVGSGLGGEVLRRDLALAGGDAVGERADDERARADRVVVARDHEVGLVGIAVRVDERDHRQVQALRLADGERFLLEVDDEDRVGLTLHVGDAAEVRLELLELGLHRDALLRRQQGELAVILQPPEVVQVRDPVGDRAPVREQAAEPAVRDVRHADALGLGADGVLRLLLGADEEDRAPALGDVPCKVVCILDELLRLLQVDDVDAAALGEDETLHLRVPATCLMAEVNSSLQ